MEGSGIELVQRGFDAASNGDAAAVAALLTHTVDEAPVATGAG